VRSILLNVTRLYLVFTVLAGVPAGASRAVLCVASNGHVAIEAGEGRCGEFAPATSGNIENVGVCSMPDGCGDCVDLPMGKQVLSSAHHVVPSTNASTAPLALSVDNFHLSDVVGVSPRVGLAQVESSRPSFPPSRTTILRN